MIDKRFVVKYRYLLAISTILICLSPTACAKTSRKNPSPTSIPTAIASPIEHTAIPNIALTTVQKAATPTTALPTETASPSVTPGPIHFIERLRIGKGVITGIAFSQDRERILLATPIGIYLLDAKTFADLWFQTTETPITSMAFSPDRLAFATGQPGGIVQLYETATGKPGIHFGTNDFPQTGDYPTVSWSPDGKFLLIGANEGAVGLWEPQTGNLIHVLKTPVGNGVDSATQAAYSGDGRYIIASTWDQVTAWDVYSYQQVSTFPAGNAEMFISPSNELPWVALHKLNDPNIDLWDWKSGKHLRTLQADPQTDGVVTGLGWKADGTTLLASYLINQSVKFIAWDTRTGARSETPIHFSSMVIVQVASSLDGSILYGGGTAALTASGLLAWDLSSGELLNSLSGHESMGAGILQWDHDGILSDIDSSNVLQLFDPLTGKSLDSLAIQRSPVERFMGISPLTPGSEGDHSRYTIFTNSSVDPNAVYVRRGEKTWELEGGWSNGAYAILWSTDLARMASPISVWDTQTGKLIARLEGEENKRFSLDSWSKDGSYLASGEASTPGGLVVVWNPATGQPVASRNVPSDVTLQSLDWQTNGPTEGNTLALGGFRQDLTTGKFHAALLIWNVNTGDIVDFLQDEVQETQVTEVAASPDSRWLAVGLDNGKIILWDRMTDQEQILSNGNNVNKLAWSPDSQSLASSSSDGIIRVYSK